MTAHRLNFFCIGLSSIITCFFCSILVIDQQLAVSSYTTTHMIPMEYILYSCVTVLNSYKQSNKVQQKLLSTSRKKQDRKLSLFCGEPDETRNHLFFVYLYTFTLCIKVVGNLIGQEPNPDWDITLVRLLTGSFDRLTFILLRLVLQVTIYYIQRKPNDMKHNNSSRPVDHIAKLVDKMVRNRISSTGYILKPNLQGLMRRWLEARIILKKFGLCFYSLNYKSFCGDQ